MKKEQLIIQHNTGEFGEVTDFDLTNTDEARQNELITETIFEIMADSKIN
jgi:hypothetical protein